jgi:hypothetical protein
MAAEARPPINQANSSQLKAVSKQNQLSDSFEELAQSQNKLEARS